MRCTIPSASDGEFCGVPVNTKQAGRKQISAHYAQTLRHWRERFVDKAHVAGELGYDEPFRRRWTLWLALSEGGFRERRIRDLQMLFAKAGYRPELVPATLAGRSPSLT
ncbi:MAG: hypothetical protein EXQ70_03355 [Solirubrobacterales bacterium]|nr:hypothetical protein [Solirubrobacterales bacterium]